MMQNKGGAGGIDPMMLMMMNQKGGAGGMNPMLMYQMFANKGGATAATSKL
jgi:hypothetical protein